MDDIAEVLLRVTGDADDARRELRLTAAELAALDNERAEAELVVRNEKAKAELAAFKRDLNSIDRERVSPEIGAEISGAMVKLAILEREIKRIDGMDADVDVDVRRGAIESVLGALSTVKGGIQNLIPNMDMLTGAAQKTGNAFSGMGVNVGAMSVKAGQAGPALAAVVAVLFAVVSGITAVIAAAVAMVASLTLAVGAIGALATAALGALGAFGAFGFAVAQALKNGGPMAQKVTDAVGKLGGAFKTATDTGVKAFLGSLAPAIRGITPMVKSLQPAFTTMGKAAGGAVTLISQQLARLGPQFRQLISGASELAGPVASSLGSLLAILLNIANAAMPFLVEGAQRVADKLKEWAAATGNAETLGGVIETIVGHLKSWWNLGTGIVDIFAALFGTIAGQGKGVVDSLAEGAHHLADWIRNNPEVIKKFFSDMIPLAAAFLKNIGALVLAFLTLVQAAAPGLTLLFNIFTKAITMATAFWQALMPIAQVLGQIGAAIIGFMLFPLQTLLTLLPQLGAIFTAIWNAIKTVVMGAGIVIGVVVPALIGAGVAAITAYWNTLKGVATAVWNAIKTVVSTAARAAVAAAVAAWQTARAALTAVWNGIRSAAVAAWNAIRSAVGSAARSAAAAVTAAFGALRGALAAVWGAIRGAAVAAWNGIRSALSAAARGAATAIRSAFNALKGALQAVWNGIKSAAVAAWAAIRTAITTSINQALSAVKALAGQFFAAGKALVEQLAKGITAGAGAAISAAKGVADKIRSLLPGSEPKDSSSPLRNLGAAGRALVSNFAAGITAGASTAVTAAAGVAKNVAEKLGAGSGGARQALVADLIRELRANEAAVKRLDAAYDALSGKRGRDAAVARAQLQSQKKDLDELGDKLEDRIKDLRNMGTAVGHVVTQMEDAIKKAVKAFALSQALKGLDNSPMSKELAALQQQQTALENAGSRATEEDQLADARQTLATATENYNKANAAGDWSTAAAALRQQQAAAQSLARLERDIGIKRAEDARQARIAELQAAIAAEKARIEEMDRLGQLSNTKQAQAYEAMLTKKTNALVKQLAKGQISYKTFVSKVNSILGKQGVKFTPKLTDEKAFNKARTQFQNAGHSMIASFGKGLTAAAGLAKSALRGVLNELRNMLPGSEPKDKSSPLRGLAKAGQAIVGNVARGLSGTGDLLASKLSAEVVSARVAIDKAGQLDGAGAGGEFHAHFAAAAPGYADPVEAAAKLGLLLRQRGLVTSR